MGLIKEIKRWWESLFQREAQDCYKVDTLVSGVMQQAQDRWYQTYGGRPDWTSVRGDDAVETINFAKKLCNETARLTTLALGITVEGSPRAKWLQKQINSYVDDMTHDRCEYACAYGYIVIKPNSSGLDYVLPSNFVPTGCSGQGKINAGIFIDRQRQGKKWYTRLEYHRFDRAVPYSGQVYRITNRVFSSDSDSGLGRETDMADSPWSALMEEAYISGLEKPLFAIFGMPVANNIEPGSAVPMSLFSNAMTELKRLDIASQRMADEIFDSGKIIMMGDALIAGDGNRIDRKISGGIKDREGRRIPRYVRAIPGSNTGDDYHEINPVLNTEQRMTGINHYLDSVGVKCGYSTGQFVLNGRTGQITATQVEADDRETIQTIKQIRDSLKDATNDVLYALDKWADLYNITPVGVYEANYSFGDITYNFEEDKQHHYQLALQGKYPWEEYYVRFLKYSREEARKLLDMARKENEVEGPEFGEE